MEDSFTRAVMDAAKSLASISKVRCVVSLPKSNILRTKRLLSWPNSYTDDPGVREFLREKGVNTSNPVVANVAEVSYDDYHPLEKFDLPELTDLKASRAILDILQIAYLGKTVDRISAAWDKNRYPDLIPPTTMNDTLGLEALTLTSGSFLAIDLVDVGFTCKVKPFLYQIIRDLRPEMSGQIIYADDRLSFTGQRADKSGRSRRLVVGKADAANLLRLAQSTNEAIDSLADGSSWAIHVREQFRMQADPGGLYNETSAGGSVY